MRPVLCGLLLVGVCLAPAVAPADGGGKPTAATNTSKAAKTRELWMQQQQGFFQQKKEICELSKAYEAAKTPEERTKLKALIREKIENLYTLQEHKRQEAIRKLEQQLNALKKSDQQRRASRKTIIDEWAAQLTDAN